MLVAGVICVGFACGDEYHQSFVDGRGPSARDVGIDSIGVFAGIITVRIFCWIVLAPSRMLGRLKLRNQEKEEYWGGRRDQGRIRSDRRGRDSYRNRDRYDDYDDGYGYDDYDDDDYDDRDRRYGRQNRYRDDYEIMIVTVTMTMLMITMITTRMIIGMITDPVMIAVIATGDVMMITTMTIRKIMMMVMVMTMVLIMKMATKMTAMSVTEKDGAIEDTVGIAGINL